MLSKLTAEEKARLAALERKKEAEAKRKAEELARQQAAAKAEADRKAEEAAKQAGSGGDTGTGTGTGTGSDSSATTKADKVLAFARAQIGKPYVWGATGPSSYDCSGLTQAAWKAAGVDIPVPPGTRWRSARGSRRRICSRATSSSSTTTSAT